ncbi:MAG: recombinase RecA [Peptoniphilaceae bacterium]|uniref:recombinase RecA n=1 Tax=Parvimonas sp. TaxID=1944660 RepID=UPI0025DC520D|nr:recombinase RecA [Parvimonas sp.]MCI5997244.1 recombinase RecA [Parvimonas sp.]MDD7764360.1 recombinase RecA [Peptoniphilaceae bacterium]MDY3050054.1 recombinase RecA [Parvimonas sp.]
MATKKLEKVERIDDRAEREKALKVALDKIEKDFGKGTIMRLGDAPKVNIESISTGAMNLDIALGIGGIPKGRIIEIYGPESSGKTTLTLHIIAEAQKSGGVAAFIDAEHALDPEYAKVLGVDIDNLLVSQPNNGEEALAIVDALVRSSSVDLVIVDSVAALVPRAEIEGNMGDSHMGLHARLMSQALRKLAGIISKSNTTVVFINQLRANISTTPYGGGPAETTTGGRALKFYSSVRIEIKRAEQLKVGDGEAYGNKTKVKISKNKMAPPFKTCEFDIIFGEGISKMGIIVDMAADKNIIKKAGAWYSCGDIKLGQGKEKAKQYFEEHPAFLEDIKQKIYASYGIDYEKKDVPETLEEDAKITDDEIEAEELLLDDLVIE